jgi:hypothetical protein
MSDLIDKARAWDKLAEKNAQIERLRAALEPFQRNVEALSLSSALGHIGRDELWNARHAYVGNDHVD